MAKKRIKDISTEATNVSIALNDFIPMDGETGTKKISVGNFLNKITPFEVFYFAPYHAEGKGPDLNLIWTNSLRQLQIIHAATGMYTIGWDGPEKGFPVVNMYHFIPSATNSSFMRITCDACMNYGGYVSGIDFQSFNDFEGYKNLSDGASVITIELKLFSQLSYL